MNNKVWLDFIYNNTYKYLDILNDSIINNKFEISKELCIGVALLKIHGGYMTNLTKGSTIQVDTKGNIADAYVIDLQEIDFKIKVLFEKGSGNYYSLSYNSITSMYNPVIPLNETPFKNSLYKIINYIYSNYVKLQSPELNIPIEYNIICMIIFNYIQYEINNHYSTIPQDLLILIGKSMLDISLLVSDLPSSISFLQLSHLFTFNSKMFYDITFSSMKQYIIPSDKKVTTEYSIEQRKKIETIMMLGANEKEATLALESGQWNADIAANLFLSGDIRTMLQEKNDGATGIAATLSENCMVPVALAKKALELRSNPNDAAMWLLENKGSYSNFLTQIFNGKVTNNLFKDQNVDFKSLFEVNEEESDKSISYYNLTRFTGNEEVKVGQILYINITGLNKVHKFVKGVFLFQQKPFWYISVIIHNKYTILVIPDGVLGEDIYLLKDDYGYHISEPINTINYLNSLSYAISLMRNRETLIHLMTINPQLYNINDPYIFLQYYKRLSNGYSLDTKQITSLLRNLNQFNEKQIITLPFYESFNMFNKMLLDCNNLEVEEALKESSIHPEESEEYKTTLLCMMEDMSEEEAKAALAMSLIQISPCERTNHVLKYMSSLTIAETLWNLRKSTCDKEPTNYEVVESLHPAYKKSDYYGTVTIPNCKAIRIFFDSKCNIGEGDLVFSTNKAFKTIISSTKNNNYSSFLVHSNTVHYRFYYESESSCWGYRFYVVGLTGIEWGLEKDILTNPSFEWSLWTLTILIYQPNILNYLHHDVKLEIYNALIEYLKTPAPFKSRIIHILTLLFRNPKFFDEIPAIQAIESLANDAFNTINQNQKSSNLLKSIIELYCVAEYKVHKENEIEMKRDNTDKIEVYLLFYLDDIIILFIIILLS